jgi:hypothetical protein
MVTVKGGLWADSRVVAVLVTVLVIEWFPSLNAVDGLSVLAAESNVAAVSLVPSI